MKKKIIIFAPHPDDETWGCGGTIAKRISEGYEVLIVVLTDGRYAFKKVLGINSDPTPEELKKIRKEEVKRAVKILGVPEENIVFLDFIDGELEKHEKEAEEKIDKILRKNQPSEIYVPYKKDCHPDHRATYRIVKNVVKKLGISAPIYQYSITQRFARIGPLIDSLLNFFRHNIVQIDISKFLSLKERAIKEFKSEVSIISSNQQNPLVGDISRLLKNKEMFYVEK